MSRSSEGSRRLVALGEGRMPASWMPAGQVPDGDALPVELPGGRLVYGDEGQDQQPALWLSEGPATAELWGAACRTHGQTGLWPLLLDSLHSDSRRPWDDGELWPVVESGCDALDVETLLAGWWVSHTTSASENDGAASDGSGGVTAPFGQDWPGLAAALPLRHDPGEHAARCAADLLATDPKLRLGLIPTDRASDVVSVVGWDGAANYTGAAELSAVLRSWQERFGAIVVGAGFAELYLSVAAPPGDLGQALGVAAEHFAFCPDNVWQGPVTNLAAYAKGLISAPVWSFWWD